MIKKPLINDSGNISELNTPDYLDLGAAKFATLNNPSVVEGALTWDSSSGTLNLGLKGGNVTLPVGQTIVLRVYNGTGSTLSKGQLVYISGAQGSLPSISLANANAENTAKVIGAVSESISNASEGFIIVKGVISNIDTSGFSAGSTVWLGTTNGSLSVSMPASPNYPRSIGIVLVSNNTTGSIFIDIAPYLGSLSSQNSSNVSVSGGNISGITDLAIADGGTGASTRIGALNNLRIFIQSTTPDTPQSGDIWFDTTGL